MELQKITENRIHGTTVIKKSLLLQWAQDFEKPRLGVDVGSRNVTCGKSEMFSIDGLRFQTTKIRHSPVEAATAILRSWKATL